VKIPIHNSSSNRIPAFTDPIQSNNLLLNDVYSIQPSVGGIILTNQEKVRSIDPNTIFNVMIKTNLLTGVVATASSRAAIERRISLLLYIINRFGFSVW
jgi:hypothetical protein